MYLAIRKMVPHPHDGFKTPCYLISHCDPDDGYGDDFVESRCRVTLKNIYALAGKYESVARNYPAVLIDLKDDAIGEKCPRIMLVFDPEITQGIYGPDLLRTGFSGNAGTVNTTT